VPQVAGGRLYSDTMGRLTFIMFLVFSLPVGMHHLLADPEHGSGFKFLQSFLTFLVALPTLLTVFSITASLEIAGRHRGGRGRLGWIRALPWGEPMVLAVALSLVMLGFGGFGGLINMSYAMNAMIHNTSWVTAHFHLIFGGAVVIMYFAIAYEMWPRITGKPLWSKKAARWQLWLWFWGMLVTTIPWHIAGLMGQPRRVAIFDYSLPFVARMGPLVEISVIGGFVLLASAVLLIVILARSHFGERALVEPLRYALAVNPPRRVPASLNGFGLWNKIVLVLMIVAYGYPIGQFFFIKSHSVPAIEATR
jgi:cytochrome c oxidase subunit 1